METNKSGAKKIAFGPEVSLQNCPNLYAPQNVKEFTPPPTGIDNLGIVSTDTFSVPGVGEAKVEFSGWVRVARSNPTAENWEGAEVYTMSPTEFTTFFERERANWAKVVAQGGVKVE